MESEDFSGNYAAQKKRKLYENQVELLNTFLKSGAITRAQFEKSLNDLTEKMGYKR